MFRANWLL